MSLDREVVAALEDLARLDRDLVAAVDAVAGVDELQGVRAGCELDAADRRLALRLAVHDQDAGRVRADAQLARRLVGRFGRRLRRPAAVAAGLAGLLAVERARIRRRRGGD